MQLTLRKSAPHHHCPQSCQKVPTPDPALENLPLSPKEPLAHSPSESSMYVAMVCRVLASFPLESSQVKSPAKYLRVSGGGTAFNPQWIPEELS